MSDTAYFSKFQVAVSNSYNTIGLMILPQAYRGFLCLKTASFPIFWYNLKGNILSFKYVVSNVNYTFDLTIPLGNYTATELADISHYDGVLPGTTNQSNFFIKYNYNQNTFQLQILINPQISSFVMIPTTLSIQMGFTNAPNGFYPNQNYPTTVSNPFDDINYPLCNITFGDTYANLNPTKVVYVKTNFQIYNSGSGNTTIACIPVTKNFGEIQQYVGDFSGLILQQTIGFLNVNLYDENFNSLAMNGIFNFEFNFKVFQEAFQHDTVSGLLGQLPDSLIGQEPTTQDQMESDFIGS